MPSIPASVKGKVSNDMEDTLLSVNNLRMHYKVYDGVVRAVDDVTFRIQKGEAVGLVGESGCGKTATALTVIRLLPKAARVLGGSIHFLGRDILELDEDRMRSIRGKEIAMIFQDPLSFLNPVMKTGDQVADVLRFHEGLSKDAAKTRALELFKIVQIPAAERAVDYYPHQMSGGMRQRVMIAAALACHPAIAIADEPTTALDVTVQAQIVDLIKNLKKNLSMSLLLITHDLGIVAELCDQVCVMYAGKIVEAADVYAIYENPKHPYTEGLLRSNLSLNKTTGVLNTIKGMPPDLLNPPVGCRFHPRCPSAMKICSDKEPSFLSVDEHHQVACWLYSQGEQK
jgi:peptide/nickel transport system ATP-binding protein/oligopeptide transport system ATP-binding protein